MTPVERVFLFGASGHAKVVVDIIERAGRWHILGLCDDDPGRASGTFFGHRLLGGRESLLSTIPRQDERIAAVVTIGDNAARRSVSAWLRSQGYRLTEAVHPSALVARAVRIGPGAVLAAGAIVNSDTEIEEGVIINTAASVDHDCTIGAFAHIAPGVHLCGGVEIGSGSLIGAGSTVIPGIRIGDGCTVGAGAVVTKDVPARTTVVGCPARTSGKR